jgi:hypothetical protein
MNEATRCPPTNATPTDTVDDLAAALADLLAYTLAANGGEFTPGTAGADEVAAAKLALGRET